MLRIFSQNFKSFQSPTFNRTFNSVEQAGPLVPPTLPPMNPESNDYTLILDLDETLLHTEWFQTIPQRYIVHERPFVREFLKSLKSLPLEVVIFTAGLQSYADTVINIMDRTTHVVKHRLYRQHTSVFQGRRFKDLSLLKRDLSRTLIVDNSPSVFLAQPDNGCVIQPWEGHFCLSKSSKAKKFMVAKDFALIYLFFWIECLCMQQVSVPDFIRSNRHLMKHALEHGIHNNINHYRPPFPLGVESTCLLNRCMALERLATKKPIIALPKQVPQTKQTQLQAEYNQELYISSGFNYLYS